MKRLQIQVGPIAVNLPDENQTYFSIFHDLADLTGDEFQRDAVKKLRHKLKNVTPKPTIDWESDNTYIKSSNPDTITDVLHAVSQISLIQFIGEAGQYDYETLKTLFKNAKLNRPKPKHWQAGDVFAIPLLNGSFSFGQVLVQSGCTCALFEIQQPKPSITPELFNALNPISILHLSNGDLLNTGEWPVIFNRPVSLNPDSGSGGRRGEVGSQSFGQCGTMSDLANAYWGLQPWNVLYDQNYYERLLLPGLSRPTTVQILGPDERKLYRNKNFGVD